MNGGVSLLFCSGVEVSHISSLYFDLLISNTEMRNMYTDTSYFPQYEETPCSRNSMEVISAAAEARMD